MSKHDSATTPRVRPRDRKQRIEHAAATAFSRRGYHAVSMQDIADSVGISAPALYRHFPSKYALFVSAAMLLVDQLAVVTADAAELPLSTEDEGRVALGELIRVVTDLTIELRATSGIYKWEGRYLEQADRERLNAGFELNGDRFIAAHRSYRPDVDELERAYMALGTFAVFGSISAHDTVLARPRLRALLTAAAWAVLNVDVSTYLSHISPSADSAGEGGPAGDGPAVQSSSVEGSTPAGSKAAASTAAGSTPPFSRREQLLEASVRLFGERGYNETTIEEIATEVDLTPSGVYRHFDGKHALLLAVYERATQWLYPHQTEVEGSPLSSVDLLRSLIHTYIEHSFRSPELMRVFFAEKGNLTPQELRGVQASQAASLQAWVDCLLDLRPELNAREATVLVHAALGLITDQLAILPRFDDEAMARLIAFTDALLGIGPADESPDAQ